MANNVSKGVPQFVRERVYEEYHTFAQCLGALVKGMTEDGSEFDKRIAAKIDAMIEADKKEHS